MIMPRLYIWSVSDWVNGGDTLRRLLSCRANCHLFIALLSLSVSKDCACFIGKKVEWEERAAPSEDKRSKVSAGRWELLLYRWWAARQVTARYCDTCPAKCSQMGPAHPVTANKGAHRSLDPHFECFNYRVRSFVKVRLGSGILV